MTELVAFILPPAIALAGMRLFQLLLGREFRNRYPTGFRFALGLGLGMLVFTQATLLGALIGLNLAGLLARSALVWGILELFLLVRVGVRELSRFSFQKAHLWLLLLLPLFYYFWVLARLAMVEGFIEFDAITHWAFKSKILYLTQGREFLHLMHNPNLAYFHLDYPVLVSALYTLTYGAVGGVNEFVVKTWAVWMVFSLCLAVLSLADTWRRPRPLPIAIVFIICFLPATLAYVTREGATIPMVFFASLMALLMVRALAENEVLALAPAVLIAAGCAMSKFEGMIYASLWFCVWLPLCWRRGWLKDSRLWKAIGVAVICILPYAAFRLNKPIPHFESGWPDVALHSPGIPLQDFPQVLGLGLGERFFSREFFTWGTFDGRLYWAGHWAGWQSFVNYELGVVPWLILIFLGLALWQRHHRAALLWLSAVIVGVLVFLAFVIACLPHAPEDEAAYILSKTGEDLGRYYYPYFLAWFLGIVSIWFPARPSVPAAPTTTGS